ncbi:hypothetical protein TOTORO_02330 [Serratia phage vB_SmaS-Totoro]|nr:hypothetical protein TOTORO_02330 [Serratia phage vB_SmaS-Totoro]
MDRIKILLNMDDLFDTRYATALKINHARAIDLIKTGYGRRRGEWVIWEGLGITEEQWRREYAKRDNETLKKSIRSKLVNVILEVALDADKGPRAEVGKANMEIVINEWPYSLSSNVKATFVKLFSHLVPPNIPIGFIRRAPKLVTPKFVTESFTHFINYDMVDWIDLHLNTDEEYNMLKLELIGPQLFQQKPDVEDFALFKGVIDDVHRLAEQYVSPSMSVRYISTEYFNSPF